MQDARFDKLAQLLVEYSTQLKRNETVLIEAVDVPHEMTIALVRAARKAGAIPFTQIQHARVTRELAMNASERQLNLTAIHELARMMKMDAYIGLRGSQNITELSDVPPEQMKLVAKKLRPVQDQRVKKNQMGGASLAHAIHGSARRHEHGRIRRLLLRRLHARLPQAATRHEGAQGIDG